MPKIYIGYSLFKWFSSTFDERSQYNTYVKIVNLVYNKIEDWRRLFVSYTGGFWFKYTIYLNQKVLSYSEAWKVFTFIWFDLIIILIIHLFNLAKLWNYIWIDWLVGGYLI